MNTAALSQLSECRVTVVCISASYIRSLRAAESIPGLCKLAAFRCGIVESSVPLGCCADSLVFGYRLFGTIYPSHLRRSSVMPSLFLSILFHFLSFFLSFLLTFCSLFCFRFLLLYSPSLYCTFSFLVLPFLSISLFSLLHLLFFLTYSPSRFTLASHLTFPQFLSYFHFPNYLRNFPVFSTPSSFPLFVK